MQVTRQLLQNVRADIDKALAEVAKKHGVLLLLGNARFNEYEANFKLNLSITNESTVAAIDSGLSTKDAKAIADWATHAWLKGLKLEWCGQTFTEGGTVLKVIGFLPNKRVNNVLVEGKGGGRYVMPAERVCAAFTR